MVRNTAKQWWDERKDTVKSAAAGAVKAAAAGDPDKPVEPVKRPLPVRLAKVSLVLPVLAFLIASISGAFVGEPNPETHQIRMGIAVTVLLLGAAGLVSGGIALAGLRKNPILRIAPFAIIGFPASFYIFVTALRVILG